MLLSIHRYIGTEFSLSLLSMSSYPGQSHTSQCQKEFVNNTLIIVTYSISIDIRLSDKELSSTGNIVKFDRWSDGGVGLTRISPVAS
jgi:hypothetical protein